MDVESFELRDVFIDPDEMYGGQMAPDDVVARPGLVGKTGDMYTPNITQRDFLKAALESTDLPVKTIQQDWSMLDDQHEANIPDAKRRTRVSKGTSALTQEQRDALNQVFYGIYRGALGQNNFYREFSKRNKKQADSLEAWKNQKKT